MPAFMKDFPTQTLCDETDIDQLYYPAISNIVSRDDMLLRLGRTSRPNFLSLKRFIFYQNLLVPRWILEQTMYLTKKEVKAILLHIGSAIEATKQFRSAPNIHFLPDQNVKSTPQSDELYVHWFKDVLVTSETILRISMKFKKDLKTPRYFVKRFIKKNRNFAFHDQMELLPGEVQSLQFDSHYVYLHI